MLQKKSEKRPFSHIVDSLFLSTVAPEYQILLHLKFDKELLLLCLVATIILDDAKNCTGF